MTASIDARELAPRLLSVMRMIADFLIPADQEMPSGGEVLIGEAMLEEVLKARPDLRDQLPELLEAAGRCSSVEAYLEEVTAFHPSALEVLGQVVAGGYYMSLRVRSLIGYPGQQPLGYTDQEDVIDLGPLLARAQMRGFAIRSTSDTATSTRSHPRAWRPESKTPLL